MLFYKKKHRFRDQLKGSLKAKGKLYLLDLSTVNGMIVVYHNKLKTYGIMISYFHSCDELKFKSA